MSDEIKPALTAEQWAEVFGKLDWQAGMLFTESYNPMTDAVAEAEVCLCHTSVPQAQRRHAVAALALHGQPFGFTDEMLRALRLILPEEGGSYYEIQPTREEVDLAWAVVDRIAALLPPVGAP